MKRIFAFLLCVLTVISLVSCGADTPAGTDAPASGAAPTTTASEGGNLPSYAGEMNVSVLAGPTGIGAVKLWEKSDKGETVNTYHFNLVAANDEIVAAVSSGKADVAAVATNLASSLYNKTKGGVTVLAVNTLGVLSILTNGTKIESVADLRGKTIVAPGQGANPEYILRYVLAGNGIDPDRDVTVRFVADGSELPGIWAKEPTAILLAPQPVATSILMKYAGAEAALDMTDEWNKLGAGTLMMGCVIVRNDYLAENLAAVEIFLDEYKTAIEAAEADVAGTAALCEKYGIIAKAAIAQKAIPSCGLTFVRGAEMKKGLSGYLGVMFAANPKSVGGALPGDSFYYNAK